MEAKTAMTLERYLREKGPLSSRQASRIGCLVAQALRSELVPGRVERPAPIHPGRIILRDASSIDIAPEEGDGGGEPLAIRLAPWVSPEEAQGLRGDFRSQYYSLGATLFALVTGVPPYERENPKETLRAHLREPIPDPRSISPQVDVAYADLVTDLLNKDANLRLAELRALVEALKACAQAAPEAQPAAQAPSPPPSRPRAQNGKGGASAPPPTRRAPAPTSGASSRASRISAHAGSEADDEGDESSRPGRARVGGDRPSARARSRRPGTSRRGGDDRERPKRARAGRDAQRSRRPARARAGRRALDDGEFDEDALPRAPRRVFALTWVGLGVGAIATLGLFLWMQGEAADNLAYVQNETAARRTAVADRRVKEFRDRLERERAAVGKAREDATAILASPTLPPAERKARVRDLIDATIPAPDAMAIVNLYAMAPVGETPSVDELREREYRVAVDEIDELRSEGRLGEALERTRAAERAFSSSEALVAELGKKVEEISKELSDRWKADRSRYDELLTAGSYEEARDLLEGVKSYGTPEIRAAAEDLERALLPKLASALENGSSDAASTPSDEPVDPFAGIEELVGPSEEGKTDSDSSDAKDADASEDESGGEQGSKPKEEPYDEGLEDF